MSIAITSVPFSCIAIPVLPSIVIAPPVVVKFEAAAASNDIPLVIKLLQSSQGKGVILAESKKAASGMISAFQRIGVPFIAQEFIEEASVRQPQSEEGVTEERVA